MKCHEIDYDIIGDDMQLVEIELDPNETVIAEAGAMNYIDQGIVAAASFLVNCVLLCTINLFY